MQTDNRTFIMTRTNYCCMSRYIKLHLSQLNFVVIIFEYETEKITMQYNAGAIVVYNNNGNIDKFQKKSFIENQRKNVVLNDSFEVFG